MSRKSRNKPGNKQWINALYTSMTEKEKMLAGMIYDANNDAALIAERLECRELCRDYNDLRPRETGARDALLRRIRGDAGRHMRRLGFLLCCHNHLEIIIFLPLLMYSPAGIVAVDSASESNLTPEREYMVKPVLWSCPMLTMPEARLL